MYMMKMIKRFGRVRFFFIGLRMRFDVNDQSGLKTCNQTKCIAFFNSAKNSKIQL